MSADAPATGGPHTVPGIADHPLRVALTNEVHARPYEQLAAPMQASYLALLSGPEMADRERALVAQLCERFGGHPPAPDRDHFSADLGPFRIKWERHTEFSSYLFLHAAAFSRPFTEPALERVPEEWLGQLPGETLVAVHVALEPRDAPERGAAELAGLFASQSVAGSRMAGDAARAWTDFHMHADGFTRVLLQDVKLAPRQAGRLVQRLLEIETYRMMALLALPLARRYTTELARLDQSLSGVAESITRMQGLEDEHRCLDRLSALAAEVERIGAATNYRFSAARAYRSLVARRISDLREQRIEGLQTIQEFMDRRLAPAMDTCDSVHARVQDLSTRVARASQLLRTRIDVSMEAQSRDLLESMDRRARLQLRLQETVEGLSVVVLSYYLLGLVGYGLKALEAGGVGVDVELVTGAAVVPLVALVFLGMRRLRRAVGTGKD